MTAITIRNVPEATRNVLAARAAAEGRSLQEYLSRELERIAARPSLSEALDLARGRARHYPAIDDVLDHLDADRR